MEKEIIIVTAFFDIGRGNIPGFQRSVDKYIESFAFWARIKNKVIIFCDPQNADKIREVRRKFSLEDRTKVVEIKDFYECEGNLHKMMVDVEKTADFMSFRWNPQDISNTANYDYVQFFKYYCLKEAATMVPVENCNLAWVDFGYNAGGVYYQKTEEFDFEWKWDFPGKINLFAFNNPDNMSLIDSLQFETDCLMGGVLIVDKTYCQQLHDYMREMMLSLIDLECIDDDQHLLLMVYKKHKEDFNIIMAKDWLEAFKLCSHQKFSIKEQSPNIKKTAKITRELKRVMRQVANIGKPKRQYEADFIQRMLEKAKKYHR